MINQPHQIEIRQMQPGQEKEVLRVMRRAFPFFMHLFFSKAMIRSAEQVLVAWVEGDIKGGILVKSLNLPGGGKGGVVDWIFTDPSGRGLGLGAKLMDASVAWFDQAGCDQLFAIVEGFNTSSSNLFARRGFSILSFREQMQRFGFPGFLSVWLKTFHLFDMGHFLWGKPAQSGLDSPSAQLVWALILNVLIALVAGLRTGSTSGLGTLLFLPLWVLILTVLRTTLMMLSARIQGLDLRYRLWETGFLISVVVSIIYGAFIPIPGSLYPKEDDWYYHRLKTQFGKTALAGFLPGFLIAIIIFLSDRILNIPIGLMRFLSTGLSAAFVFTVVDIIPFFPLVSFNGRRIWDWKPWVWSILAGVIVVLWALLLLGV